MRYKWLFVFFLLLIWPSTTYAADRILMIDDVEQRSDDSLLVEAMIRSYQSNVEVKKSGKAVDIHTYDAIFLFSEQAIQLPEVLEEQLSTFEKEIIVIGAAPKSKHFWKEWRYEDEVEILSLNEEPFQMPITIAEIRPPAGAHIVAAGEYFNQKHPYIVQKDRQYAIASAEFNGLRQLAFNHLLAKIFPIEHGHEAFIRLTDINVNTDVKQLKQVTSYLTENKIPLLLSVDSRPITTSKQKLKDNKALIQLLKELQSEGARIVLKSDEKDYEKDIRLFIHLGLYPLGIETDALLKSDEDYEQISNYSSLYFDSMKLRETQVGQYILPTTVAGIDQFTLYPDTLGFIDNTTQSSFRMPEHEIELLQTLDSSMISFAYYAYLGLEPLQQLVEHINRLQNVEWIEWDKQQGITKISTQTIHFSEDASIKIENHRPLYDRWLYIWESKSTDTILWLLAIFVLLFVLLFTIYIIFMRVRLRKRLFNERK